MGGKDRAGEVKKGIQVFEETRLKGQPGSRIDNVSVKNNARSA